MGKSPARWIKTVLLGKKTSKSNHVKAKEKIAHEKDVHVRVKDAEVDPPVNPSVVPSGQANPVGTDEGNTDSRNREFSVPHQDGPSYDNQMADVEQVMKSDTLTDAEKIREETAATKAQAAFRGYLARRAFKALKGIIRLQALIRGHLVRRQAVSSLYCIIRIVKFQALVRGSRIRCSDIGLEMKSVCVSMRPLDGKFKGAVGTDESTRILISSRNAFVKKLLAPSPAVLPLRIQYHPMDPNSILIWLERWSSSCPWKPAPSPKRALNPKPQRKQGSSASFETESGKSRRTIRKGSTNADTVSAHSCVEAEKPRRNLKKVSSHSVEPMQENPQHELEKVKRNLRKVHNPVVQSPVQPEVAPVLPNQCQGKVFSSVGRDLPAPVDTASAEKVKVETDEIVNKDGQETVTCLKPFEVETAAEHLEVNETIDWSNVDQMMAESQPVETNEKNEKVPVSNGDPKSKEEFSAEQEKASRRASLPVKQETLEDGLQKTPKLPSYMQATESAKAKLRGHGSPRFSQDGPEKTVTRRHSLPSSTNGKINSSSPRTQRSAQSSGKGGNRSDKSLLSSKDGSGKMGQVEWRR